MSMPFTFIGQKKGMTQVFDEEGKLIVCTIISAEPNVVVQVKRKETDGYNAVQLAGLKMTKNRTTKSVGGHFAKSKVEPHRVLCESRVDSVDAYQVGQTLDVNLFEKVKFVDVQGVSKGKGYQGVMKLFNMAGGPAAHGSGFHRHMGSTGMRSTPGRCFPGGKRASRMGGDTTTVQNLRVVAIRGSYILVEGAVPGAQNGIVFVSQAIKKVGRGAQ